MKKTLKLLTMTMVQMAVLAAVVPAGNVVQAEEFVAKESTTMENQTQDLNPLVEKAVDAFKKEFNDYTLSEVEVETLKDDTYKVKVVGLTEESQAELTYLSKNDSSKHKTKSLGAADKNGVKLKAEGFDDAGLKTFDQASQTAVEAMGEGAVATEWSLEREGHDSPYYIVKLKEAGDMKDLGLVQIDANTLEVLKTRMGDE